jgi:hypothetical protein
VGTYKLPISRVVIERRWSEWGPKHIFERQRIYSEDTSRIRSRFNFANQEEEEAPITVPDYISELLSITSPIKDEVEVSEARPQAKQIKRLLSPDSPDRWMDDIISAFPKCPAQWAEIEQVILVKAKVV